MRIVRSSGLAAALVLVAAACGTSTGSQAPASAAPGTAPLGAWTATITEQDFREAGLTDAGLISENAGTFTWTLFPDGTFIESMQADHPVRWPVFRGTWAETEPGILGLRTTFPPDYVGEYIVVRWTREADGLHVRLVEPPEPTLKVHFETHPWLPAP